ncbi:hypothetical protein A2U01_0050020, partial [Trifolium medium]|nr:hypothetical protein [Trifolium medium]
LDLLLREIVASIKLFLVLTIHHLPHYQPKLTANIWVSYFYTQSEFQFLCATCWCYAIYSCGVNDCISNINFQRSSSLLPSEFALLLRSYYSTSLVHFNSQP